MRRRSGRCSASIEPAQPRVRDAGSRGPRLRPRRPAPLEAPRRMRLPLDRSSSFTRRQATVTSDEWRSAIRDRRASRPSGGGPDGGAKAAVSTCLSVGHEQVRRGPGR